VAPYQDGVPTHQVLLQAGVIPIEGMDLRNVPAGVYQLVCLPMKLVGCDGAPVRAILISD
jgi:arylformamidase